MRVRTWSPLLERVRAELGPGARIVRAEKVRTGGFGGFFAKERFEMTVDVGAGDGPPDQPEPEPLPTSVLELAERLNDAERAGEPPANDDPARPDPYPNGQPVQVSTESRSFADVLAALSEPEQSPPPADNPPLVEDAEVAVDDDRTALVPLGVPSHLLPPPGAPLMTGLLTALRRLPTAPPPPATPGALLVVAGPATVALPAARTIAAELGLDPTAVPLASVGPAAAALTRRQRIADEPTAAARRRTWQRRAHPSVVALDAPLSLRPPGWAAGMLAALDPTMLWAAVSLTTRTSDVRRWLDRLGRPVDALVAEDSDATTEPAHLLALGVPVARLDGRPATPAAWATTMVERLSP